MLTVTKAGSYFRGAHHQGSDLLCVSGEPGSQPAKGQVCVGGREVPCSWERIRFKEGDGPGQGTETESSWGRAAELLRGLLSQPALWRGPHPWNQKGTFWVKLCPRLGAQRGPRGQHTRGEGTSAFWGDRTVGAGGLPMAQGVRCWSVCEKLPSLFQSQRDPGGRAAVLMTSGRSRAEGERTIGPSSVFTIISPS